MKHILTVVAVSVFVVSLGGCSVFRPSLNGGGGDEPADSFHEQLQTIRAGGGRVGQIPPEFGPAAFGAVCAEGRTLKFDSYDPKTGRICFIKDVNDNDAENADPDRFVSAERKPNIYGMEAWATLDGIPPRRALPEKRVTFEVTLVSNKAAHDTYSERVNGQKETRSYDGREVQLRLCGQAPSITPDTKYLTVSREYEPRVQSGGSVYIQDNAVPQVYVFAITTETHPTLPPAGTP